MKLVIASDIHGSAYYCRKLLERLEEEKRRPSDSAGRCTISWSEKRSSERLCTEGSHCHAESFEGEDSLCPRELRYGSGPDGTGIPDSCGLWIFIRKRAHDFPDPRTCIQ